MQVLRKFYFVRPITVTLVLCLVWLQVGPVWASAERMTKIDRQDQKIWAAMQLHADGLAAGLTQTPGPALRARIAARRAAEAAAHPIPAVRLLSVSEMSRSYGRGPLRNPYFEGTLPWQRSLHDVNLCNGNLFKSYSDIQVAPARGAGLDLLRTYNSNDARVGPFGIGWTDSYDIHIQEAADLETQSGNTNAAPPAAPGATSAATTLNEVPRTDLFGGKQTYHRDADGLYSPPPYLYDQMSSDYGQFLVNGPAQVMDDTDIGMDGTVKHYTNVVTEANGTSGNERACDYIQDRFGNRSVLTYGLSYVQADGSTRKVLTQVTDPVGRSLTFHWTNFGTVSQPVYRITEIDAPTDLTTSAYAYRVTYSYYVGTEAAAGGAAYQLKSVTLDPDGLNRTTTYTYTSFSNSHYDSTGALQTGTEYGLLASVIDPLGHTESYSYTAAFALESASIVPGTMTIGQISEPGSGAPVVWNILSIGGPGSGLLSLVTINRSNANQINCQGGADYGIATDPYYRISNTLLSPFLIQDVNGVTIASSTEFGFGYDNDNNVLSATRYFVSNADYSLMGYAYQVQNATYGQHGNALSQVDQSDSGSFPDQTTTSYYNASQYFQKQNIIDADGHTTTMGVGTDTAGTPGDPDPNVGDRGQTLWVQDGGYSDPASPSYHKQYSYTYNQYGQKLSETTLNGVVTQYYYGGDGSSFDISDHDLDDKGYLIATVQDPGSGHLNRMTEIDYDIMGRVLQITDPAGQTTECTYNSLGQSLNSISPAKGSTPSETISYVYRGDGSPHSITDNRGTTIFTYEDEYYGSYVNYGARIRSVSDPITGTVSYTYTPLGSRSTMNLPSGRTWTYSYSGGYQYPRSVAEKPCLFS